MKNGIYAKSIKEIYEGLNREESILFQIRDRKTFDKIIDEMESQINTFGIWYDEPFDMYKKDSQKNFKEVYFTLGNWRLGMCGIFTTNTVDDVHILSDYKEDDCSQTIHEKQINIFIDILDKYRNSIIISKKTFDDVRWNKKEG